MNPISLFFRAPVSSVLAADFFGLTACSSQDLYNVGQGWQQQACRKLPDVAERSRCEKSNAVSYEKYRAQSQASQVNTAPTP